MPNKNKTAYNRRIRSQRSQRRRYRTARNGGRSPWLLSSKASASRRTNNVPAKIWLSPRRWHNERKTRNLAIAAEAATHNADNTRAATSIYTLYLKPNPLTYSVDLSHTQVQLNERQKNRLLELINSNSTRRVKGSGISDTIIYEDSGQLTTALGYNAMPAAA